MDVDEASLKGLTFRELAEAIGERAHASCPKTSQSTVYSALCPGTGARDAPREFPLKLRTITRGFGLRPTKDDEIFETIPSLLTAKHVDDIIMAGAEETHDKYVKRVGENNKKNTLGSCERNKH
eukprot:8118970-Pyramimonas_sp.AAC.1